MLLNKTELEAVRTATRGTFYRRWRRPGVKTGGTLLTAIGQLRIDRLERIDEADIKPRHAKAMGYRSVDELLRVLASREGDLYRIEMRLIGDDPRIALREKEAIGPDALEKLMAWLARLDKASAHGPWTHKVLRNIAAHPHLPAVQLAQVTGFPKEWLKLNVRKLKNLGLTISHHPGYELSPRGRVLLSQLP
ncbi:MAG: hypothetical protein JNM31_01970 [Flavobacteriales bacterium]|nr:hypothetical protein [Flavobacteriales bacterium]